MCFFKGYEADESDILKRLLLKRVIFGVDLNPFSIELTKLSLWIDSFIFGTPLSFLEHHIKCGNALIGTSIKEFKEYFNALQKSKSSLFVSAFLEEFQILSEVFAKLDSIKDTTEADIKESKRLYKDEIAPTLDKLNLYLNMLNAKSFMNNEELKSLKTLTQSDNIEKLADTKTKEYEFLREAIHTYTKKFSFFNYEIEFPEIMESDSQNVSFVGFQAIVGNPPWDKTKFSDSDFFPQYQSNYRTLNNSAKKEVQANLLAKSYIKKEYEATQAFMGIQNEYYKAHFPLNRGSGDGNLFRFFVEKNLSLLSQNASLNYVLPSALMLEEGSETLRKEILENKSLAYFYSFENREGIFKDVDSRYKFALMQIINTKPQPNQIIKTMFYKTNIESVYKEANMIDISLADIKSLSPNQLALQEVRGRQDLEILSKCYTAFAPLSLKWLDFRNELHMTQDKDLFIESHSENLLPLYEGKMIWQFNADFSEAQYFLDSKDFDRRLRSKEIYRLKQDLGIDNKEYEKLLESYYPKASKEEAEDSFIVYDRQFYRLGFRAIASDTNERTLIFSLLPKDCGFGHSMFANSPKKYILENSQITHHKVSHLRICFALGIFNSLIVDFIARGMIQINVSKTYLERIPFPQPSDKEIVENATYLSIAKNALILQLCNDKVGVFKDLQKEFDIKQNEIPKTPKLCDELRAKQDIAIAKLYGLDKEEFCYLLESFKVLQNKQPEYIALLKNSWE